ncbi:hypothetical protein GVAV_003420 [Gurleya vavrai]
MPYFSQYIAAPNGNVKHLKLSDVHSATVFDYLWNEDRQRYNFLRIEMQNSLGVSVNVPLNVIEIQNASKGLNQQFDLVPVELYAKNYWIQNYGKCLAYEISKEQFGLKACDESDPMQHFEIKRVDQDYSGLELLENVINENETIHLTNSNLNNVIIHSLSGSEKIEQKSQFHMENDGRELIQNIYKLFYDLTSCFVERRICENGGFDLKKRSYKASKASFTTSANNSFSKKSQFSHSSASASASAAASIN